jgi:hypothetical protein
VGRVISLIFLNYFPRPLGGVRRLGTTPFLARLFRFSLSPVPVFSARVRGMLTSVFDGLCIPVGDFGLVGSAHRTIPKSCYLPVRSAQSILGCLFCSFVFTRFPFEKFVQIL